MLKQRVNTIKRKVALSPLGSVGRGVSRAVPVVSGTALVIYGLSRRDRMGFLAAVAGGSLLVQQVRQGFRALRDVPMVRLEESIIVARPIEDVYGYWRDFANLANFMGNLERVRPVSGRRSQWVASIPGTRRTLSWQVDLIEDRPLERLRWRTVEGAPIYQEGEVYFRRLSNGDGTELDVRLTYEPPAGKLKQVVSVFLEALPREGLRDDLVRFKRLVETGEETHKTARD
jgi:uncharacterized membrane protein